MSQSPSDRMISSANANDGDAVSETSTIRYEHEPFDTFRHKVAEIGSKVLNLDTKDIHVQRMMGGSSNRVIGFEARKPREKRRYCFNWLPKLVRPFQRRQAQRPSDKYIIRIPRDDGEEVETQVAALKVVGDRLSIPVPQVVQYDLTCDNVLGKPYMVQKRIPGRRITDMIKELNLEQKKSVMKQATQLVSAIASLQAAPGEIAIDNLTSNSNLPVCVNMSTGPRDEIIKAAPQAPIDHLLEQCEAWHAYQTADGYCFENIWFGFKAIAKSLQGRGFLGDECVLVHGDLREYNMLAEITSSTEVKITGILDWDDAHFAPAFVAYRSPFWMWIDEELDTAEHDDEKNALSEPITGADHVMKATFLEHAPEDYKRSAFAPEAMLARRMYYLLRHGIFSEWPMQEADAIIKEWDELHPEDAVVMTELDDDFDDDVSVDPHSDAESGSDQE